MKTLIKTCKIQAAEAVEEAHTAYGRNFLSFESDDGFTARIYLINPMTNPSFAKSFVDGITHLYI